MSLLIMDFGVRGHLWRLIQNQDAAYKCYWICDSVSYALAYLTIFILTIEIKWLNIIMGIALSFAINKVIESVLTTESKFDWTEYVALLFSIGYVWHKLKR